jgi:hypothetical protein
VPLGKSAFRLPAAIVQQIKEQAVAEAVAQMPPVDLSPALEAAAAAEARAENARQMVLNDRARDAVSAAQMTQDITTLSEAIAALNALSDSYVAQLGLSLQDRAALNTNVEALQDQQLAFIVMADEMTEKLNGLLASQSQQDSDIDAVQAQLVTMASQIASFLARPLGVPILSGTKVETMPLIALGVLYTVDIPVTGARVGMPAVVAYPAGFGSNLTFDAPPQVEANDLVRVRFKPASLLNAGTRTFTAYVWKVI